MAHYQSDRRLCNPGVLRLIVFLMGLFLVGYIVGPPLFWHSKAASKASCPSCACDCSSDITLSLPLDCGKDDPEMSDEMKKDIVTLLSEEINLQRNVSNDSLDRTKALIIDAKKTSSHYQKEAEKCNAGMETCEEAREKAEAAVSEERKLSALWEKCARENGWLEKRRFRS
ncbi:hypothetical protein LguiA_010944 [Lonicera macranthoides]